MKKITPTILTFLFFTFSLFSQNQLVSEKNQITSLKKEMRKGIHSEIKFDDFSLGKKNNNLKSTLDDFGNPPEWDWVNSFGGSGKDVARKIAIGSDGLLFITGSFSGEINIASNTYTSIGRRDAFLAKFQNDGTLVWFKQYSAMEQEYINSYDIHLDENQNIYFTGYFSGDVSFGEFDMPGYHPKNMYLVKVNSHGVVEMALEHPTFYPEETGLKVDTDGNGNIFVLGSSDGTTDFRHKTVISKYSPNGSLQREYHHDQAWDDMQIVGDKIYYTGTINEPDYIGDDYLEPGIYNDAFIAKSNTNFEFEWAKIAGHGEINSGDSRGTALYVSDNEDIFHIGNFRSNISWDDFEITGSGGYVSKCNSDGDCLWTSAVGEGIFDNPTDLSVNNDVAFVSMYFRIDSNPLEVYQIRTFDVDDGSLMLTKDFAHSVESISKPANGMLYLSQDEDQLIRLSGVKETNLSIDWAKLIDGSSAYSYGIGMDADQYENIYNFGYASNTIDYFGRNINKGLFLAKQLGTGDVIWIVEFPDADPVGNYMGNYISVDTNSNSVYITGEFYNPLVIPGGPTLISPNETGSLFLIKYDLLGNFQWAVQEDIDAYDPGLASDKSGNVLLCGMFSNTITIGDVELVSAGGEDLFVAKYNSAGELTWAKRAGGEDIEYTGLISTDGEDNVYLTGEFNSVNVTIDDFPIILEEGDGNILLAKLDPQGNTIWANTKGGSTVTPYADYWGWPTGIHVDPDGYITLKGTHSDSAHFDNIILVSVLDKPENKKRYNNFVAKFDPNGNTIWANSVSCVFRSYDYNQFDVDQAGNVYTGLEVKDTVMFGNDYTYTKTGKEDLLVYNYANDGSLEWVKSIKDSETGTTWLNSVLAYNEETIFVSGYFYDYLDFGTTSLTANNKSGFIGLLGTPVGITEYEKQKNPLAFSLFPNPAHQQVNIQFPNELPRNAMISISDLTGKEVYSQPLKQSNQNTIGLSEFLPGIYFIKINSGKQSSVEKLVVK